MMLVFLLVALTGVRASSTPEACDDVALVQSYRFTHDNPDGKPKELRESAASHRADEKATIHLTDTGEGEVRFVRHGNEYLYKMEAFSLYTPDANVTAWTHAGLVDLKRGSRFFKSREEGRWAQAMRHEDGTVSGLFEDQGRIMRISRSAHLFLAPRKNLRERSIREDNIVHHYHGEQADPYVAIVDNSSGHHSMPTIHYQGESNDYPLPSTRPWDGEEFFPGCFTGDSGSWEFKIGVIADTKAYTEDSGGLQDYLEQAVSEASFVFERQMHIHLAIDNLLIYQTTTGLSGDYLALNDESCADGASENFMDNKLDTLRDIANSEGLSEFQSARHLFTGCGNGIGVIGLAWVGTLCNNVGYNTGVNQMTGSDTFLTFAHELGHNLGMWHPFDREDSSGGIMDYGNGLLDGYYQFNKQYRADEACPVLSNTVDNCNDKFTPQGPTFAPTPFPTLIPGFDNTFIYMIEDFFKNS